MKTFREALCEFLTSCTNSPHQKTFDKSSFGDMSFLSFHSQEALHERICDLNCSVIENCKIFSITSSFEDATEVLLKANFVYFIGLGASAISAHYAYIKPYRIGIDCSFESDTEARNARRRFDRRRRNHRPQTTASCAA